MRSLPLKRKIDVLEVYCPNQDEGCKEVTKLGALDAHKNGCGFAKVVCTQECGKLILRKDLTQHCNDECSKRKMKCKYCDLVDHFDRISIHTIIDCEEYPVKCPRGCTQSDEIKRKNLKKHAEVCPLEEAQCPFSEAGCVASVLRKDLNVHMESNAQQHLTKLMKAYSKLKIEHDKLSSQVAKQTFIEPVRLTVGNSSFAFSITSSRGWSSPPFSVLDGYTFSIKHKEEKKASLMLLKGEYDDWLEWPMNLPYTLEIGMQKTTTQGKRSMTTPRKIRTVQLSRYPVICVTGVYSEEIADIDLWERELLNYELVVRLVPQKVVPHTAIAEYEHYFHRREEYLLHDRPM
jgi:TNF receptor-associated factor 4